ncbi:MAG: BMC domain-containing protein [Candidatus Latescibacterota bacterium]|nr:BMC domain-containing protein [Candidatus Latescibacterota bacterium]
MSESAIGLIETRGLVGVIEAADTAAKSADIQLLGVERIGGGFVSLRFRGEVAAVQSAVDAGSEAARRVGELVASHVIPAPRIDVDGMFSSAANPTPTSDDAGSDPEELDALSVPRLRQLARRTSGVSLQGRQISLANRELLLTELKRVLGSP